MRTARSLLYLGSLPRGGGVCPGVPPVNRMTDRCKNITLPQTSFAGGNNESDSQYFLEQFFVPLPLYHPVFTIVIWYAYTCPSKLSTDSDQETRESRHNYWTPPMSRDFKKHYLVNGERTPRTISRFLKHHRETERYFVICFDLYLC